MRRLALLFLLALAPALRAQAPDPGAGPGPTPGRGGRPGGPPPVARGPGVAPGLRSPGGPAGDIGAFLLAHTADLKLTDQQVTRLAGIERRAGERRQAAMRTMDSLASRGMRRDSAGRGPAGPPPAMRAEAERLRDQRHAELR